MRNMWIICRKELRSYFVSPVAYLLLTMFAVIFGYFFWTFLAYFINASLEAQFSEDPVRMNVNDGIITPLLGIVNFIGLFFIPIITMRLFAEEKRTGTIELLVTSPVRDGEIILGKWLASVLLYLSMLLFSGLSFLYLFRYGTPDWKPLLIGYLGLILQAGSLLAIGTFISTLTRNQIIAGATSLSVCLLLYVMDWSSRFKTDAWAKVLAYLSVFAHFEPFSKGVIDSKDLVFYLSLTLVALFLTARSVESMRWRS